MSRLFVKNDTATVLMGVSTNLIRVIEYASRVCYDATDKMTETSWEKYIGARVKTGHESVIEHGLITYVIDLSQSRMDRERVYAAVKAIEFTLSTSNSLIHYVNEGDWNPHKPEYPILILSGNLKMWRDLFKYLYSGSMQSLAHSGVAIFKLLIKMFQVFNFSCNGIFTLDIPEMQINESGIELIKSADDIGIMDGKMVTNWDERKVIDINSCDIIYRQRNYTIDDIYSGVDGGVEMRLISIDNFARDFVANDETVPPYLKLFLMNHTKDMNSVTYAIKMPRVVTQQECRHRVNSISQRSQRYVDEVAKDAESYCPDLIDPTKGYELVNDDGTGMIMSYEDFMKLSMKFYKALREDNVPKEDARFVLTGAVYSTMVITKPFYTLPHYFKERCSDRAQMEIREPARKLKAYLNRNYSYVTDGRNDLF